MSFRKPHLKRILILALLAGLLFPYYLHAAIEPAVDEKIISAVLKNLARAFTATADIEKIKRENIAKIERMDEEKFRKRSTNVCNAIREMSGFMREKYGVTPGMTKEQAVRAVQSLDKKKIYEIIDAAPDAMPA
ncbi:MAG: hypothetical protein Q8O22_03070, partial [Candidatus Omnitrophota bacterium]|nr:hypothetical protein [Candidatus Omnitrophota bacterium]